MEYSFYPLSRIRRVEGGPGLSVLNEAVRSLRRAVLDAGPEVFLGTERQLLEALGISRPTFRQATKLLRHEKLLCIKFGVRGGFFTQAPCASSITELAALVLGAQGTTMQQLQEVVSPLQAEAVKILARNPDQKVRASLLEYLAEQDEALQEDTGSPAIVRALKFERMLVEKTGNPALTLVMNLLRELVRDEGRVHFVLRADRIQAYKDYQQRLARAIHDGDEEMACLICERQSAQFRLWMAEANVASLPVESGNDAALVSAAPSMELSAEGDLRKKVSGEPVPV